VQADQNARPRIGPRSQPLQNQPLRIRVQTRDRFINQQQGRTDDQSPRQQHPRPLAARHIRHAPVDQMPRPNLDQSDLGTSHGVTAGEEGHAQRRHLDSRQIPGDPAFLRQIGDPLGALAMRQSTQIITVQPHRAARQRRQPDRRADGAALARAIGSAQGHHLARPDRQVDAAQHRLFAQTRAHLLQRQQAHSRHSRAARQAINANRGAPIRAVKTPSLSS